MQFYPISRAHILAPKRCGGDDERTKPERGGGSSSRKKKNGNFLILRCASIGPRSIVLFTHKRIGISLSALLVAAAAAAGADASHGLSDRMLLYIAADSHIPNSPAHTYTRSLVLGSGSTIHPDTGRANAL